MDELEKGVRHCYLKAAKLPKGVSMKAVSLPANVGGLGWLPWYDMLMKNRVATINRWIGTETSIGYVLRWAMGKVQSRVATEVPVGKCGDVGEYVEGK